MSNNTTTTACIRTPDFFDLVYNTAYFTYNIATPLYFVFSFCGNGILLLAFLDRSRSERAYMYQLFSASTRTIEVLVRTLCSMCTKAGLAVPGVPRDRFQNLVSTCYLCTWYGSHLSSVFTITFMTLNLLLAIAMTGDRVFSLVKPLAYKNMNHRRNQSIVLAASIAISFSLSAFDTMRMNVAQSPDGESTYISVLNTAYMSLPVVQTLALVRVFFQATALVVLVVLSVALCYFYRTRFVNLKAKVTGSSDQQQDKSKERTLVVITLTECSMTILDICVTLTYYTVVYCYPIVYNCWQPVIVPINDSCHMIVQVSNFYVVLAISTKFRAMVKRLLRSWFKRDGVISTTNVVSIASQRPSNSVR